MRTTDIQILYKQAYWSQTNLNYKHGFFYNTIETKREGYKSILYLFKKGTFEFYTFVHDFYSYFFYSQNAQGILGAVSTEH